MKNSGKHYETEDFNRKEVKDSVSKTDWEKYKSVSEEVFDNIKRKHPDVFPKDAYTAAN